MPAYPQHGCKHLYLTFISDTERASESEHGPQSLFEVHIPCSICNICSIQNLPINKVTLLCNLLVSLTYSSHRTLETVLDHNPERHNSNAIS